MGILRASEVANLLSLNIQTVYRKTKRGEIPHLRLGSTIRYNLDEILKLSDTTSGDIPCRDKLSSLPSFLSCLFWDCDPKTLKPDSRIVIERILESGDFAQVEWLLEHTSRESIKKFLRTLGKRRLSSKSYNFWNSLWGVNYEQGNTLKTAKKSLGENSWR